MRAFITAGVVLAATGFVQAGGWCSGPGDIKINDNCFTTPIKAIAYQNLGANGSYTPVKSMYPQCTMNDTVHNYTGSLGPFDEGVSLHFRGPIQLKQFAVYTPGSSNSSQAKRSPHQHRHNHGHAHFHEQHKAGRDVHDNVEAQKRAVGDLVFATIDGKLQSWTNTYNGLPSSATPSSSSDNGVVSAAAVVQSQSTISSQGVVAAAAVVQSQSTISSQGVVSAAAVVQSQSTVSSQSAASTSQAASSSAASSAYTPVASGDWVQTAYYESSTGITKGVTFLNNKGGGGSNYGGGNGISGVWDGAYSNSLSYASDDVTNSASSPRILKDITVPSNVEFSIFSDTPCSANDAECGYFRNGTVAYHGFDGASKIFLFEFSMPHDVTATGSNADMPSIWMLNAQIPRTSQYTSCSCSASGCGEFDLFEVLLSDSPGNTYCKSTVHGTANSGGASNYFYRPSAGTMKAAVVMTGSQAVIKIIDDSYTFGNTLSNSDVSSLQNVADAAGPANLGTVLFKLGA